MAKSIKELKFYFLNRKFLVSVALGVLFLGVSIVVSYWAVTYATESASNSVTDIILSNIPVFDFDGLFIYGPMVFWVLVGLYLIFVSPQKIPFTLKSIALFELIRSAFISLTHIGPFPTHVPISASWGVLFSGSDLFFSGHTGLPFLLALAFWDDVKERWFFVFASLFFGAVVLLAHLHYSIDVFAAFFITYAIFGMSERLFKSDRELFLKGIER